MPDETVQSAELSFHGLSHTPRLPERLEPANDRYIYCELEYEGISHVSTEAQACFRSASCAPTSSQ